MKKERLITKRVNIYDGQKINEKDLDTEQIHNNALSSNLVLDFHGSGIIKKNPFSERILLDTKNPGLYGENDSQNILESGNYDGRGIYLDLQPSDLVRGNRLEFELVNLNLKGREKTKILILGKIFNGIDSDGLLNLEILEFSNNCKKITQNFYISILAVFFNNFSGGTGKTENATSVESLNLIGSDGYLIIREPQPLSVYPCSKIASQIESPNYDLINFITSSESLSITDEINLALNSEDNIDDIYIELSGNEKVSFDKNGATTVSYGQKFLSKSNNLQKVDLLLSVERDTSLSNEEQLNWSGDLVISIHSLLSEVACSSDAIPDDLIDFDPELTPLVEISFSQEDLEALGYVLNETSQVISFNFAGTLIADPNIEPSIEPDKYYAILISRRGDNRTGTIYLDKGYDKVSRKTDLNITLSTVESFSKQQSKFFEYDPISKRYVNDSQSSLWFVIHSDTIEVSDGSAYTESGIAVSVPKTEKFVGGTEISYFEKNIPLRTTSEGSSNYLILSQEENFSEPGIHPRTNNQVYTRIQDVPSFSMVNEEELEELNTEFTPLILAKINDLNTRSAETISGTFNLPGLIKTDSLIILDPSNEILNSNLVNRIVTPDIGCNCNSSYRITKIDCETIKLGDLNSDGELTSEDLSLLLNLIGNTINSSTTEKSILGGDIDILDFIKSDLNDDDTIDGTDIELLEDAIDGYVNFSAAEEIKVIYLRLENILSSNDYPIIFTDTANSGISTASTNEITITLENLNQALTIRAGDTISIPSEANDAGDYIIESKEISSDNITVILTVLNEDGTTPSFNGSTTFNAIITSGTAVNIYADNPNLANIPFEETNFEINFVEAPFEERFINICNLSRDVGVSFLELENNECMPDEEDCIPQTECSPTYKNQTYIPGDLFLPNGNILTSSGSPHPGDFEFVNIQLPLPPGTITGCSLNLYNNFIKSKDGTELTEAGFPAMKFSDGTLVGCQDSGTNTDLSKGRVKFSTSIASIFVDSLADGYTEDGYTVAGTDSDDSVENINENYLENYYSGFSEWTENSQNDTAITDITHASGTENPAIFELTTSSNSGQRFGKLDSPISSFSDDFIVDFQAVRTLWPGSSLTNGTVSAFGTVIITNDDNSVATLKLGWKVIGGYETKLFYSGVIVDENSNVLSTFSFETDAPDNLNDEVIFRLRRINDVVSAYYIVPDRLTETTTNSFGHFIRLGTNPELHPGEGNAVLSYEISQINSPTSGEIFSVKLERVSVLAEYSSSSSDTTFTVSRNLSTNEVNRVTLTFPFNLPRRTTITSAILKLTSSVTDTLTDSFKITPINLINADNLGRLFNAPVNENLATTFTPDSLISGTNLEIEITDLYSSLLAQTGHLSGFIKGFVIEPEINTNESFSFTAAELSIEYEDSTTGVVFKVGIALDPATGIVTLNTRNVLYDALTTSNRTIINFGVFLKKSGFKNSDVRLTIDDLTRLGVGSCYEQQLYVEDGQCYYIVGGTNGGNYLEGPFDCVT